MPPTISSCASRACRCSLSFVLGGFVAAGVGLVFGVPSLRLRGFYLAVSTLAAQFFLQWALTKFGWFSNYSASGVISAPPLASRLGSTSTPRSAATCWCYRIVPILTIVAVRWSPRRWAASFIAVRDNELAAKVIGVAGAAREAARLHDQLLLHRRRRSLVGVLPICARSSRTASTCPLVPDPVHDHHRRHRQYPRRVSRCRVHQRAAAAAVPSRQCLVGGAVDSPAPSRSSRRSSSALLIIVFLIAEPKGLSALIDRATARFTRRSHSA